MKREFLEGLGLSRELTDSIISEHGKSVEALKLKCSELEEKIKHNTDLEAELELERQRAFAFKQSVITELVDGSRPSSSLARQTIIRMLEDESEGNPEAALRRIRAEHPDAFEKRVVNAPIFSESVRGEGEEITPLSFSRLR